MERTPIAGIIGAGGITNYHIQGYLKSGVEVKAIADLDIERAKLQAKKHNIANVFAAYGDMLKRCPEISLVSVCVPNKYHAEITIDCLNSGRNVFCEKPQLLTLKKQ